jgi:hypothetical protein
MRSVSKGIGKVGLLAPKLSGHYLCPRKGALCLEHQHETVVTTHQDTVLTTFNPESPWRVSGSIQESNTKGLISSS